MGSSAWDMSFDLLYTVWPDLNNSEYELLELCPKRQMYKYVQYVLRGAIPLFFTKFAFWGHILTGIVALWISNSELGQNKVLRYFFQGKSLIEIVSTTVGFQVDCKSSWAGYDDQSGLFFPRRSCTFSSGFWIHLWNWIPGQSSFWIPEQTAHRPYWSPLPKKYAACH